MPKSKPDTELLVQAQEDIRKIVNYLSEQSTLAADNFIQKVWHALDQLALFPESAPVSKNVRLSGEKYRTLVLVYNYLLFYKIHKQTVIVYRILNGKRNYGEFV
ncbi:translation repressor RelE [Candidatus Termititenax persephonae]|uniref:Translation repressor RelE n=1 Tax=Candidatus Termititenax persephonae TaxID=2218525 RepID=A0A388TGQ9_9BACT|nr:translation repressor RelE [Candidatus Termititenax persephonae]